MTGGCALKRSLIRWVCLWAAAVLLLFGATASAESGTCGDGVAWEYDESSATLSVTYTGSGSGAMQEYAKLSDTPWYAIRKSVKHLIVGEGVTAIAKLSFWELTVMEDVSLPESLRSIGNKAFDSCYKLRSVTVPEKCPDLGTSIFSACSGLKSATLPDGIKAVPAHTFNGCSALESVHIPETVTSIEKNAFAGCTSLQSITLPKKLGFIGAQAFRNCYALDNVVFPSGLYWIEDEAFCRCFALSSAVFSGEMSYFGYDSFAGCTSLKVFVCNSDFADPEYTFWDYTMDMVPRLVPVGSIIYCQNKMEGYTYTPESTALAVMNGGVFKTAPAANGILGTPEKEGYVLEGWYEDADFSGAPVTAYAAGGVYYAKWQKAEPAPVPRTGDTASLLPPVLAAMLSAAALAALRRRKKEA